MSVTKTLKERLKECLISTNIELKCTTFSPPNFESVILVEFELHYNGKQIGYLISAPFGQSNPLGGTQYSEDIRVSYKTDADIHRKLREALDKLDFPSALEENND